MIVQGVNGAGMGALQGFAAASAFFGGSKFAAKEFAGLASGELSSISIGDVVAVASAATGTVGTGAIAYNASNKAAINSQNMSTLNKMLNGLPEYEAAREGIFLYALNQVVDDPTMTNLSKDVTCGENTSVGWTPSDGNWVTWDDSSVVVSGGDRGVRRGAKPPWTTKPEGLQCRSSRTNLAGTRWCWWFWALWADYS